MPLYVNVPNDDPKFHNQTSLMDVDDETFNHAFDPKNPKSLFVRVYRFLCFIVFLGPIRIVLTIFAFLLFYSAVCILPVFKGRFKNGIDFKIWAAKIVSPLVRLILFTCGVVWITKKGEVKEDTRTMVSNHLCFFDAASLFLAAPCQFVATAGSRNNTLCYRGSLVFDMIFVDRTKAGGATKQITDAQQDNDRVRVAIFPEGRVTNGSCMIGFRTGAFVAETPLQPIALRYKHWLMPESMATIAWCEWNFWLFIYQMYSIPFLTLEITVHDQQIYKGDGKTPEQRAHEAQLMIANSLGCPAYSKTNKGTLTGKPKTE